MTEFKKIPKKHQPKGFEIIYEDRDVIVGNKAPGFLTVSAKWNTDKTVHSALNTYVRKGQLKSKKCVYVVHRIDQFTSGILIFAKTPEMQVLLKDDWKNTIKTYYAIVHGKFEQKTGILSSYLEEDEDYVIHSSQDSAKGKLSYTEYAVVKEVEKYSLLKINLLTGRKNQIRVHMADAGHPVVGDEKYGKGFPRFYELMLHSWSIEFSHPFSKKRLTFTAKTPNYFRKLIDYAYDPAAKPDAQAH